MIFTDRRNARFRDREEAGIALGEALAGLELTRPLVFGLPRGGVPIAVRVAERLDAPLDVLLVRKLGAPGQPELAMGAIAEGSDEIYRQPEVMAVLHPSHDYIASEVNRQRRAIAGRRDRYGPRRTPDELAGHDAIVVDDGIATGATMHAAISALKNREAERVTVAVPVAPPDTIGELERIADRIVCLHAPPGFGSVGAHYRDFAQVDDEQVMALLER